MKRRFTVEGSLELKQALISELVRTEKFIYSQPLFSYLVVSPISYKRITGSATKFSEHFVLPQQYQEAKQAFIDYFDTEPMEVGRWYTSKRSGSIYRLSEIISGNQFKYDCAFCGNMWIEGATVNISAHEVHLTPQDDLYKLLSEEAKNRGFKEGVKLAQTGINARHSVVSRGLSGDYVYHIESDILETCSGSGHIYCEGKWAEILPSPEYVKITRNGGNCTQDSRCKKSTMKVGEVFKVIKEDLSDNTSGTRYDVYVCEGGYVLYKEYSTVITEEEYERLNVKTPDITINGYKAEYFEDRVKFGCQRPSVQLIKDIVHFQEMGVDLTKEAINLKAIADYYSTK